MEDNRPLKGNTTGQYNLNFIDPTNDISAYYNGLQDLQQLVDRYLETVVYHGEKPAVNMGKSQKYNGKIKKECFLDHCSVCIQKFRQGEEVKVLPCQHCFHQQCVMPWFSTHNHCPNCRYELSQ